MLQLFGDIFAELAQRAAAIGTAVAEKMADHLTRQILRQRLASGSGLSSAELHSLHGGFSRPAKTPALPDGVQAAQADPIFSLLRPNIIRRSFSMTSFRCSICSLLERRSSASSLQASGAVVRYPFPVQSASRCDLRVLGWIWLSGRRSQLDVEWPAPSTLPYRANRDRGAKRNHERSMP